MAKKNGLMSQITEQAKAAKEYAAKNIQDVAKANIGSGTKTKKSKTFNKTSSAKKKSGESEESLRKTWMENALELYRSRNSDARYDRDYFKTISETPEGDALFKATKENATPMQAAQNVATFIKLQSGEDYRVGMGEGYDVTAGKEQYEQNDAINKNTYLTEADSWMQLTKASEADTREILDYWSKELADQTDNSKTKARLQERYDELYGWARNTYPSFAGQEYMDYYNQFIQKKMEMRNLGAYNSGVNEEEKATAQSALEWMYTGGDPVAIVENDETLRRLTDYDALTKEYADPYERGDAIMRSLIDYANKTGTSDFEREEKLGTLQAEADELKVQMEAAKEKKDELQKKENYRKLLGEEWVNDAAGKYNTPDYVYKTIVDEGGLGSDMQYTLNEPTLPQIMADPEGVEEEWRKSRASAGEVGSGNAVNLINRVKLMEPEERQLYKAIYVEDGEEAAQEYFDSLTQSDLLAREMVQTKDKAAAFQDEAPVMANVASVGTNLLSTVGRIAAWVKGEDQNSVENQFGAYTDTIRQNTREDIDSPLLRVAYDVGMGAADNLAAGFAGGQYAEWIQALGALGSGYMESMEQTGGDVNKARLTGAFEGLWEYATEKINWGVLENAGSVNDPADAIKYILKSMATEGLEEGTSGLLGDISGALIEGKDNEIRKRIKYYRDNGYSMEETAKIVAAEQLKEIGYEMLVGGLTGGMLSGGNVVSSLSMQNAVDVETGRQIERQGSVYEVLKAGMESKDRSVRKVSERLMNKLNLTDESQAVLPNDTETKAELQFVQEGVAEEQAATTEERQNATEEQQNAQQTEGLTEEQKAEVEDKQRKNNEKRIEERTQEAAQQTAQQTEGLTGEQKAEVEDKQRKNNEKRIEERTQEAAQQTEEQQTTEERQNAQQTEGLTEEQKAEVEDKQRENNEKRIEEKTQEPSRELSRKEARQLGSVYSKVLSAMDVAVEKNSKKLSKVLNEKLKSYGESHIQEVTDAIAEVVTLGEDASKEAVDIAEAAAMRDGAIKTVFDALKVDAARMREFVESTTAGTRARSAAATTGSVQNNEDVQIEIGEDAQAKEGSISYTDEAGDSYSGEIEGFEFSEDGRAQAIINGERVAVDALVTENDDTGRLIDRAVSLKDAKAAKLMYDSYENGQNVTNYAMGFEAAYHYGEIGLDESRARKRQAVQGVTDAQFTAAYKAGTEQAAARPQVVANRSGGKVSFADGLENRISELNSNQRGAINALTRLAEMGTVNIEFYESQADENGSYMATESGSYDPSTNTIRIDINAGKNSVTGTFEHALLRVASHELTHYMRAQNSKGYLELQNYVIENLLEGNDDIYFDALVESMMDGTELTYAEAAEEVVANACEMMLKDSKAIQRLATQNRSLFSRMRSWVKSFVKSVKQAFQGVSAQSVEARLLKNAEEIQKKWDDALVGAMKNVREGGTQSESANTEAKAANTETETDGVKYSKRTTADGTTYVFVDDPGKLDVYGTDGDSISKKTRLYMREHFRGVVLPLGRTKGAYVRSDGINEYTNPASMVSSTNYESKMRAATELGNLLESSEFLNWKADDGRHSDAVRGWNSWLTRYAVQDSQTNEIRAFEGEVKIKRIARGDVFYDITKIKEITNSNMGQSIIADAQYVAVGDTSSIAQDGESVKYSKRTDGLTNREILAQAFESVAANDTEREMLTKYQSQIEELNAKQVELKNTRDELSELKKNTDYNDRQGDEYKQKRAVLTNRIKTLSDRIIRADNTLLKMEHAKPLQDVLTRESKQYAEQKVKESRKRIREQREKTELRRKIRNLADDFDRRLLKPTAKNYVPKEMVRAVVAMRELVDVNAKRTSEDAKAKIAQIEEVYKKFKEDPQFAYVHDQVIEDMLSKLKVEVETGTDIYKMDKATLEDVYATMKAMRKQVSEAVKLKSAALKAVKMTVDGREATVIDVGREMYRETMEAAPLFKGKLSDYLNWQLNPDEFFDRMGGYKKYSAWKAVGESFMRGTERRMEIQREADEHFGKWLNSKEVDRLTSTKEKDLVDIGLRDEAGKTVKVTRGMMLEAYMHLSSDDNASGFMYGGFSVPNLKKYYAGKVSESYGTGSINTVGTSLEIARLEERLQDSKLTEAEREKIMDQIDTARDRGLDRLAEMRENIEKQLTSWDKELIKAVHEWNDGRSRDLINEVTEDLYGVKRASVKNYYQINRDKAFVNTDFASISRNLNLENWGGLKDRVPSRAPILLGDITYTMANSIDQMSRYVAYARAQRDFNKLYNIRMPGMAGSVKKAVGVKFGAGERNIGVSGEQYIENYIGSITGSRKSESDLLKLIRRNLPRATMSANFRVGFSQFSAITKAAVEVGWDSLAKGMMKGGFKAVFDGKEQARLAQENIWYWSRRQGEGGEREFADMKGGTDPISKAWNWVDDKTGGWVLNLNQKIDVATTAPMYYAAQEWVKKNTKAREGTTEFKELVNQKYTDILRKTQAANTVSEMNDLARGSKSGALSILTMYKSEQFANFNILYDSIVRYRKYKNDLQAGKNGVTKADVKQAKARIANSVTSVVIGSSLLNAVIKLGVNAIFSNMNAYRDDDDEVNMGSITKEIGMEMLEDATSLTVFGGELYDVLASVIGGENYDAPSLAALDELTDIIKTAVNLATKDDADAEDYMKAAEDVVLGVGTVFGIPLENTKRQVKGAINTVKDIFAGEAFQYEASADRSNSTNMHRLAEASLDGDEAKWDKVYEEYSEAYLKDEGEELTEKEFISKFKQYIGKQYKEGELTKEEATELLKERTDINTEDDIYWKFDEWDYAKENGSTDGYSEYTNLAEAIASKSTKEIDESIAYYTSHGYKEKDVLSQIETRARKMYADGTLNWEDGLAILIKYCNSSSKDYDDEVKQYWLKREWDYAKEHDGKLGDYSKYSDFYAAVESGEDASEYVEELLTHAESKKKAKSSAMSSINSRYRTQYIDAVEAGKTEEAETIMNYALDALEYFGKSRSSQIAYIKKKWKDND